MSVEFYFASDKLGKSVWCGGLTMSAKYALMTEKLPEIREFLLEAMMEHADVRLLDEHEHEVWRETHEHTR